MDEDKGREPYNDAEPDDNERREFLRRSVYAAYATPLITALLVEKASAQANSGSNGKCTPNWCAKPQHQDEPCCQ